MKKSYSVSLEESLVEGLKSKKDFNFSEFIEALIKAQLDPAESKDKSGEEEGLKVPVFDDKSNIVALVKYTSNLDSWDGHNFSSGSSGRHLGLTQLADGSFVLIHGSQWQGERDTAEIVSPDQALQEILRSGNLELLGSARFKSLKSLLNGFSKEV